MSDAAISPEEVVQAPEKHVGTGGAIIAAVPWIDKSGAIGGIFRGIRSLFGGMKITVGYLMRPSTVITQEYPENRETLKLPERFRAQLAFNHDANGYHKCTLCRICEEQCPNASIIITGRAKPAIQKKEVEDFVWRMDSCTFCNTCVIVCPFNVLRFDGTFESSVFDRRLLAYTLNQYAGPPAGVLEKIEDPEARKAAMEPRDPYSAHVVIEALAARQRAKKDAEKVARAAAKTARVAAKAAAAVAPATVPDSAKEPDSAE
jgi:NADH-quinone oxidoreductase subunit I